MIIELQKLLFTRIYEVAFWLTISFIPWDVFLNTVLRFLVSLVPGLSFFVETIKDCMNWVGGTHLSVGDVIILCMYNATLRVSLFRIYEELKALTQDFFVCIFETLKRRIVILLEKSNYTRWFKHKVLRNTKDLKTLMQENKQYGRFGRYRKGESEAEWQERMKNSGKDQYSCCFGPMISLIKGNVYMFKPKNIVTRTKEAAPEVAKATYVVMKKVSWIYFKTYFRGILYFPEGQPRPAWTYSFV